jgi:hypothetical protein
MNLYLDDDSIQASLVKLLVREGHAVQIPADAGIAGENDPVHHPGVLIVRRDNDPTRDMQPPMIVRAIRNLIAARMPFVDQFHILNHWR